MKETDFLAIGDTVIDAFIKLTDADRPDIRGIPDHEDDARDDKKQYPSQNNQRSKQGSEDYRPDKMAGGAEH